MSAPNQLRASVGLKTPMPNPLSSGPGWHGIGAKQPNNPSQRCHRTAHSRTQSQNQILLPTVIPDLGSCASGSFSRWISKLGCLTFRPLFSLRYASISTSAVKSRPREAPFSVLAGGGFWEFSPCLQILQMSRTLNRGALSDYPDSVHRDSVRKHSGSH